MEKNQNIVKAIRKWRIILLFFILWQIILAVVANALISRYTADFGLDSRTVDYLRKGAIAMVIVIAITQNAFFLRRIYRTKALLKIQPIRCVVEDYIINSYRRDGKRAYHVYLLLKDPANNQLYFTYGPHSLSFYNHTVVKSGYQLVEAKTFRSDRSVVNLGDFAWLYIRRHIKVAVKNDEDSLLLDGKKFAYQNMNKSISPYDFLTVQFVEGAVDVEMAGEQ